MTSKLYNRVYYRHKRNVVCPTSSEQRIQKSDASSDESCQVAKSRPHVRWCTHDDVIITHDLSTYEQGSGHQTNIDYANTSLQRGTQLHTSGSAFDKHHTAAVYVNRSRPGRDGHVISGGGAGRTSHETTDNKLLMASSEQETDAVSRRTALSTKLSRVSAPAAHNTPVFVGSNMQSTIVFQPSKQVAIKNKQERYDNNRTVRSHQNLYGMDATREMTSSDMHGMISLTSLPVLSEVTFNLGDESTE